MRAHTSARRAKRISSPADRSLALSRFCLLCARRGLAWAQGAASVAAREAPRLRPPANGLAKSATHLFANVFAVENPLDLGGGISASDFAVWTVGCAMLVSATLLVSAKSN